jgi:hypothetical protein
VREPTAGPCVGVAGLLGGDRCGGADPDESPREVPVNPDRRDRGLQVPSTGTMGWSCESVIDRVRVRECESASLRASRDEIHAQ